MTKPDVSEQKGNEQEKFCWNIMESEQGKDENGHAYSNLSEKKLSELISWHENNKK